MSDQSQGPGWWLASDGKWYPPQDAATPAPAAPAPPTPTTAALDTSVPVPDVSTAAPLAGPPEPGWWLASDGNWYPPQQAKAPTLPPTAPTAVVDAGPAASAPPVLAPAAPSASTVEAPPPPAPARAGRSLKGPLLAAGAVLIVLVVLAAGITVFVRSRGAIKTNAVPLGVDEVPSTDLTLGDDTVVVRTSNGSAIKDMSGDGSRIVLDGKAEGADNVAPGKVVVLTGVTAVKAKTVNREGDDVVIMTEPAALTDVVQDGRIHFDPTAADLSKAVLRISPPTAGLLESSAGPLTARVPAVDGEGETAAGFIDVPLGGDQETADGVARSGTIGDYEYSFDARTTGDAVNFTLHLSTDAHGVRIGVDVDAQVSGVTFGGDMDISSSSIRNFQLDAPNLRGRAHITASAATNDQATQIPVSLIHLPMSVQIPFPLAGIPFTIGIDADAKVELAFSARGANVTGSFDAHFDGNGNVNVNNGSLTAGGAFNADWEDPLAAVEGFSISPASLLVTVEFPKVSLGLGVGIARASAYLDAVYAFSPTISGASNFTPCRAEPVSQRVTAGITGEFLGHEVQLAEHVISERHDAPYDPPTAACRI